MDGSKLVTMPEVRLIPLDMIDVPADRLRLPRPEMVSAIAATMADGHQGQIMPIIVAARGNRFLLGKGSTRIAAARKAGLDSIKAVVRAEAFTDEELQAENLTATLLKSELTHLERAEYLTEWDRLTKELGLRQWGGDKRSKRVADVEARDEEQGIIMLPCSDLEALDIDKMALSRARKIASISSPAKLAVRGSHLENHQAELLALAEVDFNSQSTVVEMILDSDCAATKVLEALTLMDGMSLPQKEDKTFFKFTKGWAALTKRDRIAFVRDHKNDLVALLKSEGIID